MSTRLKNRKTSELNPVFYRENSKEGELNQYGSTVFQSLRGPGEPPEEPLALAIGHADLQHGDPFGVGNRSILSLALFFLFLAPTSNSGISHQLHSS